MASKQSMARELVALGHSKSFNTLRQWSVERLQAEIQAMQAGPHVPENSGSIVYPNRVDAVIEATREQLTIPHLPLVPASYGAIVVPGPRETPNVKPRRHWHDWLCMAFWPLMALRAIVGV